jgi:competence protein ComEC
MWDMVNRRPLVFLLLGYLGGIALGRLFSPPLLPLLYLILLALVLAGVVYYRTRRLRILALGLLIAAGFMNYEFSTRYLPADHVSINLKPGKYTIVGRLVSPPVQSPAKAVLYLELEGIGRGKNWRKVQGRVRLTVYQPRLGLRYGDRIRSLAKLRFPNNYENPGGFDYKAYLARRGIRVVGSISAKTRISRLAPGEYSRLLAGVYGLRRRLAGFIEAVYPAPQAGLLRALILGERKAVSRSIRDEFTTAGLAHLLAISGLHVGFVGFIFFTLFRFMLRRLPARAFERLTDWVRPTKLAALLTVPPLVFYTLLVGGRTATVRATIMILAYILSLLVDRQRDLYNILALAALVILIWKPESLLEVDFQLSFVTVFFIIYVVSSIHHRDVSRPRLAPPGWREGLGRWLAGYLLVTITASVAAAPLAVFYFKRLSLVGIPANLTAIPLAWVIIPLGLSGSMLSLISFGLGKLLLEVNLVFVDLLLGLVHKLAALSSASLRLPPPGWPQLLIFYGLLLCVFRLRRSQVARAGAVSLALIGVVWWWLGQQPATAGDLLQVTFLDVGHGESSFISFPGGRNMLVDGGGVYNDSFDIGEWVVSAYLWSRGVSRLDWVVLSHAHPDHLNGLKSVVRNFEVGEVWEACGPHYPSAAYTRFKTILKQRGIPVRLMSAGDSLSPGDGVSLVVLNPPPESGRDLTVDKYKEENNRSLVLRLEYGEISFLLTGDIEREAERRLLTKPELLASTVLKVPHHGSKTSSSLPFLQAVRPRIAVFSIGPAHLVWHPSPEIFARYEGLGIHSLRTDLLGAVTIETDGHSYKISNWKKVPSSGR